MVGDSSGSTLHELSSNSPLPASEAVVDEVILPGKIGRVFYSGSWWPARCDQSVSLQPGETVHVLGVQDITLLVEPVAVRDPEPLGSTLDGSELPFNPAI